MALPSTYIGFSSINTAATRSIVLTDIDLIKQDLLNLFYTTPGENRMRPTFGSWLSKAIFENYKGTDRQAIIDEVLRIVQSDPRVTYISSTITDIPYGIVIAVQLRFNQFAVVDTLIANFNQNSDALYGFSGS